MKVYKPLIHDEEQMCYIVQTDKKVVVHEEDFGYFPEVIHPCDGPYVYPGAMLMRLDVWKKKEDLDFKAEALDLQDAESDSDEDMAMVYYPAEFQDELDCWVIQKDKKVIVHESDLGDQGHVKTIIKEEEGDDDKHELKGEKTVQSREDLVVFPDEFYPRDGPYSTPWRGYLYRVDCYEAGLADWLEWWRLNDTVNNPQTRVAKTA